MADCVYRPNLSPPFATAALLCVFLMCMLSGCDSEPVTRVLTYEIDVNRVGAPTTEEMNSLLTVVNSRLRGAGQARAVSDREIEVDVFGHVDNTELDLFKRLIATHGDLEFCILASPDDEKDKPIIEVAHALPYDKQLVEIDGSPVAEWVPYAESEFGGPDEPNGRLVKRLAGNTPEALILLDSNNLTADCLQDVNKGVDAQDKPALNFSLNTWGAKKLQRLTSANLPNSVTGAVRYLGMLLDRRLIVAPAIVTTINGNFQISGRRMSEGEADLIFTILEEGWLPVPIREVSDRPVQH